MNLSRIAVVAAVLVTCGMCILVYLWFPRNNLAFDDYPGAVVINQIEVPFDCVSKQLVTQASPKEVYTYYKENLLTNDWEVRGENDFISNGRFDISFQKGTDYLASISTWVADDSQTHITAWAQTTKIFDSCRRSKGLP
jgi:hypothetical protein